MRDVRLAPAMAASALAGACLWLAARTAQSALAGAMAGLPDWARLALSAASEEALRFCLALAAARLLSRLGLKPRWALLGVLSSCVFAGIEHVSYLVAFPSDEIYWRLGYSGPIHANAAALYALALARSAAAGRSRVAAAAVAFAAGWAWHALFNLSSALWPFPALPALGTALNLAATACLLWAAERIFVIGGFLHGRP